jgi:hypothetical protein
MYTIQPKQRPSFVSIMVSSFTLAVLCLAQLVAFAPTAWAFTFAFPRPRAVGSSSCCAAVISLPNHRESRLYFFDKVFEEAGPLGKGVTVGKVQLALRSHDRGSSSIFSILEEEARLTDDSPDPEDLASMASSVCLALLRRTDEWVAACSTSEWFKQDDAGKAESLFNDWANKEAAKFEKDYIPGPDSDSKGESTIVVVSLVIEIMGDSTK